jgi:hypothetical protein
MPGCWHLAQIQLPSPSNFTDLDKLTSLAVSFTEYRLVQV